MLILKLTYVPLPNIGPVAGLLKIAPLFSMHLDFFLSVNKKIKVLASLIQIGLEFELNAASVYAPNTF